MFLQNLLKKLSNFLKNIEDIVNNNFISIIKIILTFGIILIVFIFLISLLLTVNRYKNKTDNIIIKNYDNDNNKDDLLINGEFIYPKIGSFDLTNDYIELMPKKKYQIPEIDKVIRDYDKILEDTINNDCKFNFEKRKEK